MDKLGLLNDDALLFRIPQSSTAALPTSLPATNGGGQQRQHILAQSAGSLLRKANEKPRYSTGSRAVDELLSPQSRQATSVGLAPGTLLELTGAPGEGKTRVCVSLAVQAAVRSQGNKPVILIIDTQGSIALSSLHEAVLAACDNNNARCKLALQRIILWPCSDSGESLAALYGLVDWIDQNSSIEMVVIDSLSAGLSAYAVPALAAENMKLLEGARARQGNNNKRRRTSANYQPNYEHSVIRTLLNSLVKDTCLALTASRGISVIVTTQSKTKLTDEFGENAHYKEAKHSFAVPQFNNFWHIPHTIQVLLAAGPAGARTATVTVCPSTHVRGRDALFMTVTGVLESPRSAGSATAPMHDMQQFRKIALHRLTNNMKRAREADDDGDDAFDDSDDLMARAQAMMDFDDDDGSDGSDGSDSDEADEADANSDNVAVQVNGHAVKASSSSATVLTKDEPPDLLANAELDEARDVMQLKIDALLSSVRCPSRSSLKVKNLVALLEKLENVLLSSKPIAAAPATQAVAKLGRPLPFEDPRIQLQDVRWQMAYEPPVSVSVGGSWPMGTAVKWKGKHGWTIDVFAEMPKSLFQEKDVKDFRYFYKRAFWLAQLHNTLERAKLPLTCQYEAVAGDTRRPCLTLLPVADDSPLDFTKTRATIRIIPCFRWSDSPMDIARLHPQRNNVRLSSSSTASAEKPTPHYNSSLAADGCYLANQEVLQQLSSLGNFKQANALLKIWSLQRSHRDIAGLQHVSSILTMLLVHLVSANKKGIQRLSPSSGPWQMLKACIGFIAKHDFSQQPVLPGSGTVSWSVDDWKISDTPVMTDSTGCTNLLSEVPVISLHRLAEDAKQTLASFRLGDEIAFEAALLKRCDEDHLRFDHTVLITVPLSTVTLQAADSRPRAIQVVHQLADVIRRALTDRCTSITLSERPSSKPSHASYRLGLNMHTENATRIIEYGPTADDLDAVKAFKQFWGNKSETRRFKDGRILESVLWDAAGPAERQVIFVQILKHVLSLHLKVAASDMHFYAGAYDRLLLEAPQVCRGLYMNDPKETGFSAIMAALDALSKDLRSLKDVPLKITGVQPISAGLRYSSTFVPGSYRSKALPYISPSANYTDVHAVSISFESSGRWPEDLAAIQKVKGALLCKVGESLGESVPGTQCSVNITPEALASGANLSLDVLTAQGYIFRLSVTYLRERLLLENALLEDDITTEDKVLNSTLLKAWHLRNVIRPAHHAAISNLQTRFPAYSFTVRTLKRWVAAHMLSRHFTDEILELIGAKVFLEETSVYAPPASGSAGFARALQLIAAWDWQSGPLLVQLYTPVDETAVEATPIFPATLRAEVDRLWSERVKKGISTTASVWHVVTEQDLLGSAFTSSGPSRLAATRIQQLAQATLTRLSTLVAAADEHVQPLFSPSLRGFDFILHLDRPHVSRHRQHISPDHKSLAKRARTAQIIRHGFDPVGAYLQRAEAYLSDTASLFYDENGGIVIAGLFNPGLYEKPRNFRIAQDYPVTAAPIDAGADRSQVKFDRQAVIDKLVEMSEGLVIEVELSARAQV